MALIAGLGEASRLAEKEHAPLLLHLLALKLRMLTRILERFEQRVGEAPLLLCVCCPSPPTPSLR